MTACGVKPLEYAHSFHVSAVHILTPRSVIPCPFTALYLLSRQGDPKWRRYPAAPGSVPPLKSGDSDSGVDDLEWDLRVGLSADSSVSVRESGEGLRGKVEDMGYEMEDAQSV